MAQTKLGGGRNRGESGEEGEKEELTFREEGEIGSKSREEGEIGSESREKGDLTPCSTPTPPPPLCSSIVWFTESKAFLKSINRTPTLRFLSRAHFQVSVR